MKLDFRLFSNQLLRSELIRNVSILVTGTVLAQLLSILLQPLIRRLYSPETFGTYSLYISMVGIVAVVSSLRFDDAIVLPKREKESANVLFLSVAFNLIINLALFFIIWLWGDKLLVFFNIPPSFPISILYFIPLSVFLSNTYLSFNYWLIRGKKYFHVSANKLIRRGAEGSFQIIYALLKNPKGLIYSDIFGQIANVSTAIYLGIKNNFSLRFINPIKVKYVFRKYSDFPRYNLIPALMSTCSFYLPTIFITRFFSAEFTGYYDLSKTLLAIPIALIGSSFSNVLLQQIAERFQNRQSIMNDLKSVLYIVLVICFIEIVLILLFGVGLFRVVFGNDWIISGEISKIMVWSFAFNFIVSSFSCIFISMRKIKTYSVWQIFYFFAILSLIFFKNLSYVSFLKVFVLIEIVCYTIVTSIMIVMVLRYELSIKN